MASIGNYTRYVNPYVVVGGNEQVTKHYFSGTDRIVSRLSGSVSNFVDSTNLVDQHLTDLETRQTNDITLIFDEFGLGAVNISNQRADSGDCEVQGSCASTLYFFHPDHLGSSTFLSDETGQAYQFLLYLPWGESMAEQKAGGYGTPYKYTGKELDEEIGMYDYGARFYDPSISLWTSVDPLTSQMPDHGAYNYAFNNPIIFNDPTGMKPAHIEPETTPRGGIDGRDLITYKVTGKIINRSSKEVDMNKVLADTKAYFESTFDSENVDGIDYKFELDFSIATSMDEVSESDHLVSLVDEIKYVGNVTNRNTGKTTTETTYGKGVADPWGKAAFVDVDAFTGPVDSTFGNEGAHNITHEIGHMLGLDHRNRPYHPLK